MGFPVHGEQAVLWGSMESRGWWIVTLCKLKLGRNCLVASHKVTYTNLPYLARCEDNLVM